MRKRSEITERLTVGEPAHRLKQVKSAVRQLKTPAELRQALGAILKQAKALGFGVTVTNDDTTHSAVIHVNGTMVTETGE